MKENLCALSAELRSLINDPEGHLFDNNLKLFENAEAAKFTTFGLGGNFRLFVSDIRSFSTLASLLRFFYDKGISPQIIGNGSNVLLPDEGVQSRPVLHLGSAVLKGSQLDVLLEEDVITLKSLDAFFSQKKSGISSLDPDNINSESPSFRLYGACPLIGMSRYFSALGLAGLEFAAGIPGTLAGGIRMNAGAHGEELCSVVEQVFTIDNTGAFSVFSGSDLFWSYRHCSIPMNHFILAADLKLAKADRNFVKAKRTKALEYRKLTQPLQYPSAGSVFRNPPPPLPSAGELLEKVGLKGVSKGGVSFSDLHANWIIVTDSKTARSSDVRWLVEHAMDAVYSSEGIYLTPEIQFWES